MGKKKWIKPRHAAVKKILYLPLWAYSKLKYGLKYEKLPKKYRKQSLVLYNHQTGFDQFFIALTVPMPIYYLATEDIFSLGFASLLIRFLVAPIPIKKQTSDIKAVLDCLRVAKEGGTIAIAPEGNRTYSGSTAYINPTVAMLAKRLKLPIVFVRLEGGYGVQPRWSDVVRHGKMTSRVSRVMEPEEYINMTDERLLSVIRDELYVDEAKADAEFEHKKLAEYLERCIYVCPDHGLSEFESDKDKLTCKKCGKTVRYTSKKELVGEGFDFRFGFVKDWYEYQEKFVAESDLSVYNDIPAYSETVNVFRVIPNKKKEPLYENAKISLYGNKICIEENSETHVMEFSEIRAVSVCGKNKLNIYFGNEIYQIKGEKRFNALKYVHFYFSVKNILKESKDGKFMGI